MKTEIKELLEKLKGWNKAYRAGEPIVSDAEYNQQKAVFIEAEPTHPFSLLPEPNDVPEGRKQKLPIDMRSLSKIKTIEEINKWCVKCGISLDTYIAIGPKLDGLSLLDDKDGRCYTRGGDANCGMRSDKHLSKINPRPLKDYQYAGGEVLISRENWNKHWKDRVNPRSGETYKTLRGTMAGLMREDIPNDLIQYVTYIRYIIPELEYKNFSAMIGECNEFNNVKIPQHIVRISEITEKMLDDKYNEFNTDYECDGLVFNIIDARTRTELGRNKSTGNPNYAIAYKGGWEESLKTNVKSVNVKVSKQGFLKPTVALDSVILSGAEVQNPTGYNMKWIFDNNVAKDSTVYVKRSGSVIPKITKIDSYCTDEVQALADELATCPACGAPTTWNKTMVELCCTNPNCIGVKLAKLISFFEILKFEDFGEGTIEKLFDEGFDTIGAIFNITYEEMIKIDGLGESTYKTLESQYSKLYNDGAPLAVIMHASSCFFGLGSTKLQLILDVLGDNCGISVGRIDREKIKHSLSNVKGLAEKSINIFIDGFEKFIKWERYEEVEVPISYISSPELEVLGCRFKDFAVCFSGVRDKVLEDEIASQGGKVVSSVSKKTTHLVVADVSATTSKITKANGLGCKVISIEDFNKL